MLKKILKNDLLFHSVHGLCRVAALTRTPPPSKVNCSLLPVSQSKSKVRFTVPYDLLESSGFNKLISAKEAAAILEYFKTGDKKKSAQGNIWNLAVTLRAESHSKEFVKQKQKSQKLTHLMQGLANELAIALESTSDEITAKIVENLEITSKINPQVLAAFSAGHVLH